MSDAARERRTQKFGSAAEALQARIDSKKLQEGTQGGYEIEVDPKKVIKPLIAADVVHGVTVGTLSQIFRSDITTIRKRLKDCAPVGSRANGNVYDLAMAAAFLVKPKINIAEYLQTMKPMPASAMNGLQ